MKNRFLVLFSIMFVFGLFAAAFALSGTNVNAESAASCPMQQTQPAPTADNMDMSKVVVVRSDGDDCCQPGADCYKGGSCCKMKEN